MMCHGEDYDDKFNLRQPSWDSTLTNASETFLPLNHWEPVMICKLKQTPGIHSLFPSLLSCSTVGHEETSIDAFSTPDIHLLGMHCRQYLTIAVCHPERVSTIQFDKFLWQFCSLYQGYSKLLLSSQHLWTRIFQHTFCELSTVLGKFTNHCSIRELEGQQTITILTFMNFVNYVVNMSLDKCSWTYSRCSWRLVSLWTICSLTTAHKLVCELCVTFFLWCIVW